MRLFARSLIASLVLAPVAFLPACGGSTTNGSAPKGGDDAGAGPVDASFPATDSAVATASGEPDAGGFEAGLPDAQGTSSDAGILGADCPAVDAGAFVEGPHGPLPTVVYYGGGVLAAPQVITFTFPTTPGVATLQSFGQTITQTPWFAAVTKDYCVDDGGTCISAGAPGVSVEMSVAAAALYVDMMGSGTAATGVDLQTFMNQQIAAAVAASTIPAPGPNSLYTFYFPNTSTVSMGPPSGGGAESCQAFGGYHNTMMYTDGTTPIVYAILPNCGRGDGTHDLQEVTLAASHEIIEATTDPYVGLNEVGWYLDQPFTDAGITPAQYRNDPWATALSFGEVGDNCESIALDSWILDSGVQVQRIWSPSAAAQGHNPCIPVPVGEAYYNASPDKAIYVAEVGSTFTVDLSMFSDMARSSWRLDAIDETPTGATNPKTGQPLTYLQLDFVGEVDGGDGISHLICQNNGSTGQLKVTLLADPTTDSTLQQDEWPEADGVIYSADVAAASSITLPDGGTYQTFPYQFWPFAVVTPATAAAIGVTDAGIEDAEKRAAWRAAHHAQPPRGERLRGLHPHLGK